MTVYSSCKTHDLALQLLPVSRVSGLSCHDSPTFEWHRWECQLEANGCLHLLLYVMVVSKPLPKTKSTLKEIVVPWDGRNTQSSLGRINEERSRPLKAARLCRKVSDPWSRPIKNPFLSTITMRLIMRYLRFYILLAVVCQSSLS